MREIVLPGRSIGKDHPPFIVAELSGNHNQSLDRALKLVELAANAGAHAVKLQTYTADTMTLDISEGEFFIADKGSLWQGNSLYKLYEQAYTPWEWHKPIFDHCKRLGMIGFSTPFDHSSVDFLESLDVPLYKIASFENVDLPLISKVAGTGKPMIVSTGMSTVADMDEIVGTVRKEGCNDLVLLKCTSSYPASPVDSNLRTIPHLRDLFDVHVGLSDHTMGIGASVASIAFGAVLIERHFTSRRSDGGVDSAFSLEAEEMKQLVVESERAWQALGTVHYGPTGAEMASLIYRRSLYVVEDMKAGDIFTPENIRSIRPGNGLAPKHIEMVMGRPIKSDAKRGTPLAWDLI